MRRPPASWLEAAAAVAEGSRAAAGPLRVAHLAASAAAGGNLAATGLRAEVGQLAAAAAAEGYRKWIAAAGRLRVAAVDAGGNLQ